VKLLAQATAELQVAQGLLEIAQEQGKKKTAPMVTRSARTASIQQSLDELATVLETPLEDGIQPLRAKMTRAAITRPSDPGQAKIGLQTEVDSSVRFITRQASKVGGETVRDLLLMDAATLVQGVSLISKDAGQILDKLVSGLGSTALQLAKSAVQLLLQAYDALLALLGKDIATQARQQIKQWLDQLKQEQSASGESTGLFGSLLNRVYGPDTIRAEVAEWLKRDAEVGKINDAADKVQGLADRYRIKTEQVEKLLKAVAFARRLPIVGTPQGQVIVAGVLLAALGYTLYTGYDHVDSSRVTFKKRFGFNIPDRVEGVRETVQKAMGVPDIPIGDVAKQPS
jgi:hypothetical protein